MLTLIKKAILSTLDFAKNLLSGVIGYLVCEGDEHIDCGRNMVYQDWSNYAKLLCCSEETRFSLFLAMIFGQFL